MIITKHGRRYVREKMPPISGFVVNCKSCKAQFVLTAEEFRDQTRPGPNGNIHSAKRCRKVECPECKKMTVFTFETSDENIISLWLGTGKSDWIHREAEEKIGDRTSAKIIERA